MSTLYACVWLNFPLNFPRNPDIIYEMPLSVKLKQKNFGSGMSTW